MQLNDPSIVNSRWKIIIECSVLLFTFLLYSFPYFDVYVRFLTMRFPLKEHRCLHNRNAKYLWIFLPTVNI